MERDLPLANEASRELPVTGQTPPERRDAARDREAILAAAQRLFEREGPAAVSIERVAEEAGREARPGADAEYLADALLASLGSELVLFLRTNRAMDLERVTAGWSELVPSAAGAQAGTP